MSMCVSVCEYVCECMSMWVSVCEYVGVYMMCAHLSSAVLCQGEMKFNPHSYRIHSDDSYT